MESAQNLRREAQVVLCGTMSEKDVLRLARKYVTPQRLKDLFAVEGDLVVLKKEGGDLLQVEVSEIEGGFTYVVAGAEEVADVESDEEAAGDEQSHAHSHDHGHDHGHDHDHSHGHPDTPYGMDREKLIAMMEQRRQRMIKMARNRAALVQELYEPLHPHLYKLTEDIFEPAFLSAIKADTKEAMWGILKAESDTGLFSFPMLKLKFCNELVEEVEHFENSGLPISRPNSMNNYGLILDDIGFTPFFNELRLHYIRPFAARLYPRYGGGSLDSHHAFIVKYAMGQDLSLDFHYDSSEVTLNVCLGKEFTGGDLYFMGRLEEPATQDERAMVGHVPGRGLLHVGQHRHGATALESGTRYNLIVWCRSTEYRMRKHMEEQQRAAHSHSHSHSHGGGGHHEHSHASNAHGGHSHAHNDDGDDDGSPAMSAVIENSNVQFQILNEEDQEESGGIEE